MDKGNTTRTDVAISELSRVESSVSRVNAAVGRAFTAHGLSPESSAREVVERLEGVDRGTAQRLLKMLREHRSPLQKLLAMPGPRGLSKFVDAAASRANPADPDGEELEAARQDLASELRRFGGSYTRSVYRVEQYLASDGPKEGLREERFSADSRRVWYEAAAQAMGTSVKTFFHVEWMRPSTSTPGGSDHAALTIYRGLSGRLGGMPVVCGFGLEDTGSSPDAASSGHSFASGAVIASGTSRPTPEISIMQEDNYATAMLAQDWMTRYKSLDLALELGTRTARLVPWESDDREFTVYTLVSQPVRELVLDRLVDRDWVRPQSTACFCDRIRAGSESGRWYDRFTEGIGFEFYASPELAPGVEACPEYLSILSEGSERNGFALDRMGLYRAVIQYPIPLARYATRFSYS
jgi:hypothetical protein